MFRFSTLSDTDLSAEYTLFNADARALLREYGPAALHRADYARVAATLSRITAEQQRRAAASARQEAA